MFSRNYIIILGQTKAERVVRPNENNKDVDNIAFFLIQ